MQTGRSGTVRVGARQGATKEAAGGGGQPYTVVAVDDQLPVLQLLMLAIEKDARLRLAGIATDGHAAIRMVSQECPDAIICDVKMPGLGGLEALPAMREACPEAVILMHTSAPELACTALQLGADTVVDKAADPSDLLDNLVVMCRSRRHTPSAVLQPDECRVRTDFRTDADRAGE
jgi:DNA-binding NarL/FixJ family response regulator